MVDLILRGGRVIDPSQSLDQIADVAFADGKVARVGQSIAADRGTEIRDVSGHIVTPGLIDLHTHVYWGGTSLGIDAEDFCRRSGVTTCIDTGSAGPGNFAGFRKHVIEPSAVRILAYLHVSFAGIYGFSKTVMVGESEELRLMAPAEAVEVAEANRDVIIGIKVRVGRHSSGTSGAAPLDIALQAANQAAMPLMCHIDFPPPSYEEVLARLRPGDVLTHAFRPFPNAPIDHQGRVKDAVREARERGVIFDIGHGKGSFAFKTARAMLANGFMPDTISSDVHALCIDGPAFDQVTTLSKFLCMGMPLNDVIAATTVNAATALKRPELGSFKPGCVGDATILRIETGAFDYVDVVGEHLTGDRRIRSEGVVLRGRWWHPVETGKFKKLESCRMSAERKLAELGLTLPDVPTPLANYVPWRRDGHVIYLSGQGPRRPGGVLHTGKVGRDVSIEQAYEHAKLIGLGLLAAAKAAAGDLDKVEVLKVLGMVNAVPEFGDHPKVINGCSDLFVAVLGDRGRHARSAVGMGSLPNNISVEIEAVMRVIE